MNQITVKTKKGIEFIDITEKVQKVVKKSGIRSGICIVYVPHTTSGVTVNESADINVQTDMLRKLDELVPLNDNYSHIEGNSAAHIKSTIVGASQTFIVENGSIILGRWQGIFFCEFDGPRERNVLISVH
ncbi:secondary thiamine-phosphate synthase enzyme YjbQ [Thermodesulfobacteriota bacterium]